MVVPKKHDRLMKRLVAIDRNNEHKEKKQYSPTELSEFNTLEWDINKGLTLPPHKKERYLELKRILGK